MSIAMRPGMPTFPTMKQALQTAGIKTVGVGGGPDLHQGPDGYVYPQTSPTPPISVKPLITRDLGDPVPYANSWTVGPPFATPPGALRRFEFPKYYRTYEGVSRDQFATLPPTSMEPFRMPPSHPDYLRPSDHNPPMVRLLPKGFAGFAKLIALVQKFTHLLLTGKKIARAMEGLPDDLLLARNCFLSDSSWGATPKRVRDFIASPLGQDALEEIRDPTLIISTTRCNLRFLEAWLRFRFPVWSDKKLGEFLAERGFTRESVLARWIANVFGTGAMGTSLAIYLGVPFPNQGK